MSSKGRRFRTGSGRINPLPNLRFKSKSRPESDPVSAPGEVNDLPVLRFEEMPAGSKILDVRLPDRSQEE